VPFFENSRGFIRPSFFKKTGKTSLRIFKKAYNLPWGGRTV
jgi:hypothetical protein